MGTNETHHHAGHDAKQNAAETFLRRFWFVTFLLIPLVLTNDFATGMLGIQAFGLGKLVQFGIATIVFGFSFVFFKHAWHEIKTREYGMMTLVSLAVGAGYLFSVASTFISALDAEFYLEISTLIWVLLFGHYLEARSSSAAGDALQEIAKLLPKKAHRVSGEKEEEVDVEKLLEGDIVRIKPGEKVPADGLILEGTAHVDESLISGESKPVHKKAQERVIAGSLCLDGSLNVQLDQVGEHSTIGQIQKLIAEAQRTKPSSQRIADKASAVLTFVAGVTALLTILIWTLIIGESFVFAITLSITVLVIACPHALGLAIPTVTTITIALAAKNGVFIKNLAKIETIKKADYIVFDKTGTLTTGVFGVTDIIPLGATDQRDVLAVAASLEQYSSHIIGQSIVKYAEKENVPRAHLTDFHNIAGKGVWALLEGKKYSVGNLALMRELEVAVDSAGKRAEIFTKKGATTIFVADTGRVIGFIALSDAIKPESFNAIRQLHALDIKVAMLTGDNKDVARSVAEELGIDTHFAEVLPDDKYTHIRELQRKGNIVVMVGDGVNDAPALTQADVGVAIGAGTDVAVEAGDIVLTRNNPEDIARLIVLAKKVYRKMIQNLVWALGYNVVALPVAAGVFAAWGFFLRPEVGALVMGLSTVIVVLNALTLKRVRLNTNV